MLVLKEEKIVLGLQPIERGKKHMNEEKTRTSNQSRSLRTVMLKLSLPNMRVHIHLECYFLEWLVWIPMRRCSVLMASSPACIFPYFEIKWIYRMRNLSQSSFCGSTVEAEYCQSCILLLIHLFVIIFPGILLLSLQKRQDFHWNHQSISVQTWKGIKWHAMQFDLS